MTAPGFDVIDFPGTRTIVIRARNLPVASLPEFMDAAISKLTAHIGTLFNPAGPALTRYERMLTDTCDIEVGFPLDTSATLADAHLSPLEPSQPGPLVLSDLPAGQIAVMKHHGAYSQLGLSWDAFGQAIKAAGYTFNTPFWEVYDTHPAPDMDPADLLTSLVVPVNPPHQPHITT